MEIQGKPQPLPRPDPGRGGRSDAGSGSNFETESSRIDTTPAALPQGRRGRAAEAASERTDRLEISSAGRLMQRERGSGASAERIAELKTQLREGTLSSREAIELAARRILAAND